MRHTSLHLSALFTAGLMMISPLAAEGTATAISEPSAQIQRRDVAQGLYELAYSPAQDALFVASAGGRGEDGEPARILRLNPTTLETDAEIALPNRGFGLALDDASGRLYVGDTFSATVTVIDTTANAVIGAVQLAEKVADETGEKKFPHSFRELVIDPRRNRLYAPGLAMRDSALYVIDTAGLKVEKVLSGFGAGATGIALDAARNRLYVSNLQGELYTVDTNAPEILARVETEGDQLLNLALDTSGKRLFATDQGNDHITRLRSGLLPDYKIKGKGNQALVLNAADGKTIRLLPTGAGPVAPLVDEERARLYVTNREDGTVSVFDTGSYELLAKINLPEHPNSLALDRRNNVLFVTVKNAEGNKGKESVVRLAF